jgi:hypothetical protein
MAGKDLAFLSGEPTQFYRPAQERRDRAAEETTYRGPSPLGIGAALSRFMWAVDELRCAIAARLHGFRDEEPELRRIDGVLIWFLSSVLTAVSLLVGLRVLG